jgi:hypothetical protein
MGLTLGEVGLGSDGFNGRIVTMNNERLVVEVVAPEFEGLDETKEFLIVDGVGVLGVLMFGGVVGDDTLGGAFPLGKDGSTSIEGCVGVKVEGSRVVGGGEDGGRGES